MLATLTACNNETSTTAPEEQQNQTFSALKTTAREGATLTPEEEKANIEESIAFVKQERQDFVDGKTNYNSSSRRSIQCHTNYLADSGHACVFLNGYMYNVTWSTQAVPDYSTNPTVLVPTEVWTSESVHSCRC